MKKYFFVFLSIVLICAILFGGCSIQGEYKLLNDVSEIERVEIVFVGEFSEFNIPFQNTLNYIEDEEQFLDDFFDIDVELMSPPSSVPLNNKAIKIIYKNDEYELIQHNGQSKYRDGVYYHYEGLYSFNEDQFNALVDKYANQ